MTRLLLLHEEKVPGYYYGPSNVVANIATALQERNINISIKSIPIKEQRSLGNLSYIEEYLQGIHYTLKASPNILSEISSSDIVDLHYMKPLNYIIYAKLASVVDKPVVVHVYFPPKNMVWFLLLNRSVRLFVATNQYILDYLVSGGIPKEKVVIVPPLIECNKFKPMDKTILLKKYGIPSGRFVLLYHGRPATCRGLHIFLRSLTHLRDMWNNLLAILSIAKVSNEDITESQIRAFIRENNLEDIVLMMVNKNEPVEIYNLADIIVFPFLVSRAAMCPSLSILEAMACESVVVSSDIEELGLRYVIKNGYDGLLVKPIEENLIACLNCIKEMDPDARKRLSSNARSTILREYSSHIVSEKIIELVKKIC